MILAGLSSTKIPVFSRKPAVFAAEPAGYTTKDRKPSRKNQNRAKNAEFARGRAIWLPERAFGRLF